MRYPWYRVLWNKYVKYREPPPGLMSIINLRSDYHLIHSLVVEEAKKNGYTPDRCKSYDWIRFQRMAHERLIYGEPLDPIR